MMERAAWQEIFSGIGIFYLVYVLLYAAFMFFSVAAGALRLHERDRMRRARGDLRNDLYFPVSVLVPAYNEEVTILSSIESLLALDYGQYEVIVVDDGSRDGTSARIAEHFRMRRVERPIRKTLPCQPERAVYEAMAGRVKLTLITKENGGKGDALNMGINASQHPYFLCIDADSVLQRDTLMRIVQPVLEDDTTIAVGGMIRAAQSATIVDGVVQDFFMPDEPLIAMQIVEYDRSFLASRILLDRFNGNLIISGALGLFRKDVVVSAGGYATDTLGEDMELVMKLHVFCRNNDRKYRISYEPSAVCWSQVPFHLRDIRHQRRRWHLGLFQSLAKYRQVLTSTRFGLTGLVSYAYYLLYELLSPVVEIFGLLVLAVMSALGILNPIFALQMFVVYTLYGAVMTMTAFFQRIYTQNLRLRLRDVLYAMAACVLESVFFRYVLAYVRATAFISYRKRKRQWGVIRRESIQGGAKAVGHGPAAAGMPPPEERKEKTA
ncbi:MAG TPA: glycosyltransferase [Candidatus Limnocylindria bacterium]|nr:glycosyltransferase [Candidatus Limnocylindria bacterium]